MSAIGAVLDKLEQVMDKKIYDITPFRAVVTGVSAGKVQIRTLDSPTGGTELYARLHGFTLLNVGDEVMCLKVRGKPFILGPVQRAVSVPTVTLSGTPGTGASQQLLNGDDISGEVEYTAGTGAATGTGIVVTFGTPKANANFDVLISPATSATATLAGNYNVTQPSSATFFSIRFGSAPVAGSVYRFYYLIREPAQ